MDSRYKTAIPSVASALALLLGTTALTTIAAPALAQDEALEEVVVTGSRIVRRDFTASSPIVTVDSDAFENISTIGIESTLNKLPQFIPGGAGGGPGSGTQFGTGDVQAAASNTPGISTVNLRGLGTFRNLVLIDGRRAQPSNGLLVVDVNTIPSAAIDSVEIISGGASATYGADAVSGVVNFKLKNDFQGLSLDMQSGITEQGDGSETRISALVGGNFDDGRGNLMFGGEYAKRQRIESRDRKWQREIWQDPLNNAAAPVATYITGLAGPFGATQDAYDEVFGSYGYAPGTVAAGTDVYVNDDGTLFVPNGNINYRGPIDGQHIKLTDSGNIARNDEFGLLSSPLERYSMFGRGTFDITDDIRFFVQGNFSEVHVDQILNYSPATQFWSPTVQRDGTNTLPPDLAALLDSRADPDAPWSFNRDLDFIGPRRSFNDTSLYQLMVGFDGNLPVGDWTYEVYAAHGKTTVISTLEGFASVNRLEAILNSPGYGADAGELGTGPGGQLGYIGTCSSGLPIFEETFQVSEDCVESIQARMKNVTDLKQDVVEANIQGGVMDLPAGELRAAFGAAYRKNSATFSPDSILDAQSFLDRPTGLFASNNTAGSTDVKEIYGEFLIPVLSDIPGIQRLELEIGGRLSDYNTVGTIETYKALSNWTVNDYLSFRGGYQLANRAPNVAELFQGAAQNVIGFGPGDPCLANTGAPWGNVPDNPNRADVVELCTALNGGFNALYNNATETYTGPFPFRFPLELGVVVGNPNLDVETAKTWTLGTVIRSPFEGDMLSDMTATVDFYQIKVSDLIAPRDAVSIYQDCFNDFGNNPDFDPNYAACQLITRDTVQAYRLRVDTPYVNSGHLTTRGIDIAFNWIFPVSDIGQLNLNVQANYLLDYEVQDTDITPTFEYKGTFGQGGQYKYRTNTTLTFLKNAWSAGLRWRHLPSIKPADYATNPATTILPTGAYDIFDAFGRWGITETVSLRAGIDNLFNKQPPRTNIDPGQNNGTATNPVFYDTIGRRYYGGISLSF